MNDNGIDVKQIIAELTRRGLRVATAESCSGGMLAAALTDIPGSSEVFGWGLVTYSNRAKMELLGVAADTLAFHGAVSKETAGEMLSGLLDVSGADVALVTTGVAGPGGGSEEKPVGLVYIGMGSGGDRDIRECRFYGDRAAVRRQTVETALSMLARYLEEKI